MRHPTRRDQLPASIAAADAATRQEYQRYMARWRGPNNNGYGISASDAYQSGFEHGMECAGRRGRAGAYAVLDRYHHARGCHWRRGFADGIEAHVMGPASERGK